MEQRDRETEGMEGSDSWLVWRSGVDKVDAEEQIQIITMKNQK